MAKIICNLYTNRRSEAQRKLMPYVAGYGPSQNKRKKTNARFSRLYDIRPGNGAGKFSKEKTGEGGENKGKSEEKTISGEAYDINKQTIYSAEIKNRIKGTSCHGARMGHVI